MTLYHDDAYPEYETFKYPKVGEDNANVSIHIYDLATNRTVKVDIGNDTEYIPRIKWTEDANKLCVTRMNRHQSELELLVADAKTGRTHSLLKESNKYYIDITDDLTFLKNGKQFLWTSEAGRTQPHLPIQYGRQAGTPTHKGDFDVTSFYGVDEKNGMVYYQAAAKSPLQREIMPFRSKANNPNNCPQKRDRTAPSSAAPSTILSTPTALPTRLLHTKCIIGMVNSSVSLKTTSASPTSKKNTAPPLSNFSPSTSKAAPLSTAG